MKRVLAFVLAVSLVIGPSAAQAKSFTDTGGYWAEQEIVRLANLGLSDGYKGKFLPKGQVTRAEFAKLVVTALGLEQQAQVVAKARSPFSDLPASHWGNGYILVAYENKILNGYNDNTFRPDAPISRVEIAALLIRALKAEQGELVSKSVYQGNETPETLSGGAGATGDLDGLPFTDAETIPGWAWSTLSEAVQRGLISGYEDKTFRPFRPASRGEAAVLVSRLLAQLGEHIHYQGTVTDLNRAGRSFTLLVSGQGAELFLAQDALFYRAKDRVDWKDIQPGSEAAVILDRDGKVAYLEIMAAPGSKGFKPLSLYNLGGSDKESGSQDSKPVRNAGAEYPYFSEGLLTDAQKPARGIGLLAEAAGPSDFGGRPEASLELTKQEMKVDQLVKATGASGEGQLIAIIDTGVDTANPDLLVTSSGRPKIVEWVDFTADGKVNTSAKFNIVGDSVEAGDKYLSLPAGLSKSGKARIGFWKEGEIPGESGMGVDLNGNGKTTDVFTVVVLDRSQPGVYDTVIVDTNQNEDFRDEIPLKLYNDSRQFARFTRPGDRARFGFVLAKIKEDGTEISLGFDSNGHGTHVAGIAAGNGQITGVAPGAQVMVIKAMDGKGEASLSTIAEAVNYAATHGAKIINLSLGQDALESSGNYATNRLLKVLMDIHGVIFVVAAGNSGPGLNTMTTPADTDGIISVGAYISPAMWKQDFKWDVPKESLWFFSSMGPRFDGAMMPLILAPGSAVSTMPWGTYRLKDGTSMAAPHVAGAVALLLDNARRSNIPYTPAKVRQALGMGASPIEGYTEVEQGYGKLDLVSAWQHLQQVSEQPLIIPKVYHHWLKQGSGLYAREFMPGKLNFQLLSLAGTDVVLNFRSTQSWLKPQQAMLTIPQLTTRRLRVDYQAPEEPGLYTARLLGQIDGKYGTALEILNTVINPYSLNEANQYRQVLRQAIPPGQFRRYFVQVPEGAKSLNISLAVEQGAGQFLGRARLHLYNPKGQEIDPDLYDFAGADPDQPRSVVQKRVPGPQPGTWEVVVYSSATLSEYKLYESKVELTLEAQEVSPVEDTGTGGNYLVGINEGTYPGERPEYVTFYIRRKNGLLPYEGIMEINSRLYSVIQGRVTVRMPKGTEPARWVVGLPE